MTNYRNYEVEDFVCDDFFMEWVLNPKTENSAFWDSWQRENPDKIKRIQSARAILLAIRVKESNRQLTTPEVAAMINYVQSQIDKEEVTAEETTRSYPFGWLKIAASIFLFISIGVGYKYLAQKDQSTTGRLAAVPDVSVAEFTRIKNSSKEGLLVNLEDGSIVVLRPNSSLSFPKQFIDSTRDVTLEGTGFFEVKRNPQKPFIVHTSQLTTRVLGTSFTVSSTANQPGRVIVYTGKVMVNRSDKGGNNKWITIIPNQQVVYAPVTEELKKDTVVNHQVLAVDMAEHVFVFKETPFAQVIEKIEKAYNITVDYDETRFGKTSVTGDISKLPLHEKIKFVSKAVNAKCLIDGGRIKIY